MKIGLVSYSNHSGLGQMAKALRDQEIVDSQLIIKHPVKDVSDEIYNMGIPHTFGDLKPTIEQFNIYLDTCKPEIIIVIETPFNFEFFKIMCNKKIKVVLIPMIDSIEMEKFKPHEKYIDLVIHPTQIGYELYKQKGWQGKFIYLPWPVDTEYFNPEGLPTQEEIRTFLHNEGFGGAGFRKGTDMVYTAFQQLRHRMKDITLYIRSQNAESQHSQVKQSVVKGVSVELTDLDESIDIYKNGKIYIAPSRREGLGLSISEAMACGLPVITTNAPPMNEWFKHDDRLLVENQSYSNLPYGDTLMYTPRVLDLMKKMKFAAENLDLMAEIGAQNCKIIQEQFSWYILKDKWLKAIKEL